MARQREGNKPLLELKGVSRSFGGLMAVKGVTLDISPGDLLSIIGPNGAGKTTLLNVISGALSLTGGEVWFKGQRINGMPAYRICSLGISRTFQDLQIFNNMSVINNVMVGADGWCKAGLLQVMAGLGLAKREEKEIAERAMEQLRRVGLEEKAHVLPSSLTMRERKLLGIARALATEPSLLLLDEPVAGLSTEEIDEVADFILDLQRNGMTILLIEHRMEMVMSISHRVVVLNFGEIIADDVPAKIQQNQEVITAYLGESLV